MLVEVAGATVLVSADLETVVTMFSSRSASRFELDASSARANEQAHKAAHRAAVAATLRWLTLARRHRCRKRPPIAAPMLFRSRSPVERAATLRSRPDIARNRVDMRIGDERILCK